MWILESNGDFLQGKRMWLKPGKKYLFGRVKKDGVRFAIDHKTVSRKHFTITVDSVKEGDVGRVHTRTGIVVTDENSKAGTNVDGELLKAKSQELKGAVHSIRPGNCPYELVVTWTPQVLTVSLLKKEIKAGALKDRQKRLKELDIKVTSDYLPGQTTLLVVGKRNTAKGLQALIEGRSIVAESYIDALVYAATPAALQEEEDLCPLELDFDDNWPDPTLHLPPAGKEPTDKPAEAYRPDARRRDIFEKFTFVFFTRQQYENLMPTITTGHGKALLYDVDTETATVEQALDYLQKIAGHKTVSTKGGVLLVKDNSEAESSLLSSFIEKLASKLSYKPVDQSGFLDAVLTGDASQLKVAFQRELGSTDAQAEAPALAGDRDSAAVQNSTPPEEESSRPRKRARTTQPRKNILDDFDDDFNPDAIGPYEEVETDPRQLRNTQIAPDNNSRSVKEEPHSTPRSPSPLVDRPADARMDALFPATAAFRRAKAAAEAETRPHGTPTSQAGVAHPATRSAPLKEVKLMDVRATVKAEREREEAERRKAKEAQTRLEAEDNEFGSGPANLVQIHEYRLPVRDKSASPVVQIHGPEWKPEWEGRKNFKGFRRARDGVVRPRRKIIVPVVEVGTRSQDIDGGREKVSQQLRQADDGEDDQSSVGTEAALTTEQAIDSGARVRPLNSSAQASTRFRSVNGDRSSHKRQASSTPQGRSASTKKQRTLPVVVVDSDSDERRHADSDSDDMKFAFGSRKAKS